MNAILFILILSLLPGCKLGSPVDKLTGPSEEISHSQFYENARLGLVTWKAKLFYLNPSTRTVEIHINDSILSRATLHISIKNQSLYDHVKGYQIGKNGSIVRLEAKVDDVSFGMLRGDLIRIIALVGL